ncbi:MAG: radical SAM protein [Candidatus Scalindua sp. AMX11]|nr:MAG: radical SAM protein [Candidatus Scalindua sp.]NOG82544.1 radical SAM protein [Planctomycetota bacterium]RZV93973.1 MAG: radical SAM protein [Candidatus Scalindua sp. SCAELEC01]TDE63984.1 MAG: radical SAM protein [Candidatus Scalindua sp. AMX11]GJQ57461.1 MAG: hypothetical protein SCALA701_02620 [Candidatus Scalindua sp.]
MNSLKTYIRNNDPELLRSLRNFKKKIINPIVVFFSDINLNIRFFFRGRKGFSSVPCLVPFMRLEFQKFGNVSACCTAFTKVKSVGNMKSQTIEQIWNGKKLRRFRKQLLLGQTCKVCMPNCGYLKIGPIFLKDICTDTPEGESLYNDVSHGRVKLNSHPLRFNLANFTVCNLTCVMCQSRAVEAQNNSIPEHVTKTLKNLSNYFDKKITLYLSGNGEVLARKDTRELLQNFDSKKNSKVDFQIITNGLLFQPRMWETIKHNNFTYVNISIDAATKETYKKVRRGGNWEQLMKALEVFKKAREEGKFSSVNINMTVMKSNFKEIPQFVEMARANGFNSLFTRIRGPFEDENIFESNNEKDIQELKKVLSNPNLYGEDVDMNDIRDYVPKEFHKIMGNHLTSIWYPSFLLKMPEKG